MTVIDFISTMHRLPPPGERRTLRERAGVSQRQVADHLGVTSAAVSAWERRGITPSPRHLPAYVELLDQLRAVGGDAGTREAS